MTLPTIRLDVGFSAAASLGNYLILDDPIRGRLDTGTIAPDDTFVTLPASDIRSFRIRRGSTRALSPVIRYEPGTFTAVIKDPNRDLDPDNLSGPYVAGGSSQVTPDRAVRVLADYAGVTYALWRGSADNWAHEYFPPNYAEVTLTGTDGFKLLGRAPRTAVAAVGGGENTGARINRILDSAGWPALDRDIATGDTTLQATTLEGDALAELQLANDSELGEFYIDPAGRAYFRNRHATLSDARSATVQATFSAPTGANLPLQVAPPVYDDEQLANRAIVARSGGAEQTYTDTTSYNLNGPAVFRRIDLLMQTDSVAADYAAFVVGVSKNPERRFEYIDLYPEKSPAALYPQALGRRIGDRIAISLQPPGGGSPIARECFIRGVEHERKAMEWKTRFILQSATRYKFLILDHPTLGKLDRNALAY